MHSTPGTRGRQMMGEWTQLTPTSQDVDPSNIAQYRYLPDENYCHEIRVCYPRADPVVALTAAELAALPPVKALHSRIRVLDARIEWLEEAGAEQYRMVQTRDEWIKRLRTTLSCISYSKTIKLTTVQKMALSALEAHE
jgi:hypothetical protein